MRIKVVAVSPKYQVNVGYIARVSMNFGVDKLEFVSPRCTLTGSTAIKYSKAARGLLERARTRKHLRDAIKGTFSIATTGIWRKAESASKGLYTISEALELIRKADPKAVSIVLGRDDTGLSPSEIKECSIALFIPANPDYPVLNISHALSVLLYSFMYKALSSNYGGSTDNAATQEEKDALSNLFRMFVYKNGAVRDKKTVSLAFKSVIDKSNPTKKELRSIAAAISLKGMPEGRKRNRQ
jgi:TrmH family RNA methyltransferase